MASSKKSTLKNKKSLKTKKVMLKDKLGDVMQEPALMMDNAVIESEKSSSTNKKSKMKVFAFGILMIILVVLLFKFKGVFVAASVNGEFIPRLTVVSELEKQGGKQALQSLVTKSLIIQEARKQNISVTPQDIDQEVKKIEDQLKEQGQTLDAVLTSEGMTKDDLREQLKVRIIVEKILMPQIEVKDEEITKYITDNKDYLPKDKKADELKATAKETLVQQKLSAKAQEWIQSLNQSAKINYFVNY